MKARSLYDSDDTSWLAKPDSEVESQWVERKRWTDPRELARQVSAFANGEGGLIVIGVGPDGSIAGLSPRRHATNQLLANLDNMLSDCPYEHRFVDAGSEELLYIYVGCQPDRVVRLANGKAFRRVGSSTRELGAEEIEELRFARGERAFEDRPALPLSDDVLDDALVDSFLRALRERNGLKLDQSRDDALRNRKLLARRDGVEYLTFGGVLALGRDPTTVLPGARLRFLRFDGAEERFGSERNVVKDQWFEGPIPRIVEKFREFFRTQVREFDRLGKDGTFRRDQEYPEAAWEEAVVNALIHRSYSIKNASVFVRMFDDRLEVESPGGLPPPFSSPATIDELYSNPRNANLCHALQYLDLVRLAQEGTRRMQHEMRAMGLPDPSIEEVAGGMRVRVTLANDIERRRANVDAQDAQRQWSAIATALQDDLAIYRRKALQDWQSLRDRGLKVPRAVIASALARLQTFQPAPDFNELSWVLQLLAAKDLEPIARDLVAWALDNPKGPQAELLVDALTPLDSVANEVLVDLEQGEIGPEGQGSHAGQDLAFRLLRARLKRLPLPDRSWVTRASAVALQYSCRQADALYEDIHGAPPRRD